ncbi:MAG TPA: CRISPR system precrRNA processing endoribonuclease RAMP protein Cas6, partial [Chloroflexota bacterium]|nr:CRISPR system precrRNA processing endoribonuclease RAMP protein Cas6 [Chloroflexota bacterium]
PTGLVANPGDLYWVRITVLNRRIIERLSGVLARACDERHLIDLERVSFRLATASDAVRGTWQREATYRGILSHAAAESELRLAFLSPTAFRRGQGYATLPEPALCLSSYLRRWNSFAVPADRIDDEAVLAYARNWIKVAESKLSPKGIWLGDFGAPGQIGEVIWCCVQDAPIVRQINALVDYAFFCRTGIKTSMGMGQTRRGNIRAD